ncbi:hypothetical protein K0U83_07045 [bacterium]|nr:hypothetical protein [bacterium]
MSLTPYGAEIERANRRHRMDERNRIRRMMEAIDLVIDSEACRHSIRHTTRIYAFWAHCQAELDILNAELGL